MAAAAAAAARRFAPRIQWGGLAANITTPAAGSRPWAPQLFRRGLATWFDPDPEAPVDPASYVNYDETDLASEAAAWALYERWCRFYGVERGREDMLRRFPHFWDRARRIHEFNQSGASYTKALREHSDQTPEDYAYLLRGISRKFVRLPTAKSSDNNQ
ncbi:hypothetical protein ACP4OV_028035 [Aristida adscensionis]